MATRARKLLELVVENTTTNYEFDTVPISGDKHKNNDTNDASHELLNENCVSIQMENESTVEGRTMTESVNVDKENEVTILKVHKHHARISKTNHNYYISPVYSDESEANLSDTDPTFTNIEPR
ncbi:unnamed protein product [Colias eurytheme]|nr:unnamed protein product [Colias eurytheme]